MIKDSRIKIEYVHRLIEAVELRPGVILEAGVSVARGSDRYVREGYWAFDGTGFAPVPPEKVKVYQVTTSTTVTELPVNEKRPEDVSTPLSF